MPGMSFMDNPRFTESLFRKTAIKLFFNGCLIVQSAFIMSGLLFSYNLELMKEKLKLKWTMIPIGIVYRWIRLTPPYAVLIAIACTWMKFIAFGPLRQIAIMNEHDDCNQYWWQNLLYINNFFMEKQQCLSHTWYLAADSQLFIIGLGVMVLFKTERKKNLVLASLLFISMVITPMIIYYKDLESLFLVSPKTIMYLFMTDKSFTNWFTSTEGNLFNYILGIALGSYIYKLQKYNFDLRKYKKYGFLLWSLVPLGTAVIASGIIFYSEQPKNSMLLRLLHGTLIKPAFGVVISTGIVLYMFNLEDNFKAFLEWQGWTVPSRLSYAAYLIHSTIAKLLWSNTEALLHISYITMSQHILWCVLISYIAAFPVWMLIETPFIQLFKHISFSKEVDTTGNEIKKDS